MNTTQADTSVGVKKNVNMWDYSLILHQQLEECIPL